MFNTLILFGSEIYTPCCVIPTNDIKSLKIKPYIVQEKNTFILNGINFIY